MKAEHKPIVVVGAGVCGLTAARELLRSGGPVVVLEREDEVGGMCRTVVRDGCRVDLGSHRFHPESYAGLVREVIESVDPGMLQPRPRHGLIRFNRHYVPYPPYVYDLLRTLTIRQLGRCLRGWLRQHIRPEEFEGPPNYESYIVSRIGREAFELVYRESVQKLWMIPPRQLSVDEVKKRVETSEPQKVIWEAIRAFFKKHPARKIEFLYPPGGMGAIPAKLAADFTGRGGDIIRGARVEKLELSEPGTVSGVCYRQGDSLQRIGARAVFSTASIKELARFVPREMPEPVARALDRLTWRALRLVYCRVPDLPWPDSETFYFTDLAVPFGRISRPRLYDAAMGGEGPGELLCIELACSEGDSFWKGGTEELIERLRPALWEAELLRNGESPLPENRFSERLSDVYPLLHVNWRQEFLAVYGWLARITNLYSIGRAGLYLHNNIDQSIEIGLHCARHFLTPGPGGRRSWDETIGKWADSKIHY